MENTVPGRTENAENQEKDSGRIQMDKFEIIVPVMFGMEAFAAKEIRRLGYETTAVEDGRVTFYGDWEAVCIANLWLRTGERVLIKVAEFNAESFEELFENTKKVSWGDWLEKEDAFPVKGYSLKSKLASERDCQAIIKKAIAVAMSQRYKVSWLEETGAVYQVQFSILKDRVTLMIDTSGEPLHKRGYRRNSNAAPLRETIASAMIMLSYWRYERPLADTFCGSGTIPIEAAMIARNIAPGLKRSFAADAFHQISARQWKDAREEAFEEQRDIKLSIYASDIDSEAAALTEQNAKKAGVGDCIRVGRFSVDKFYTTAEYGTFIVNPPYGARLGEVKETREILKCTGDKFRSFDTWSAYVITSDEQFERYYGKRADKKRKVYNGMMKCNIYQYFGPKPPRE